jgi:exonuclease III
MTVDQKDLTEIYRIFHPTAAEYTFFSTAHRTFSKIDHILGDKAVLTNTRKLK